MTSRRIRAVVVAGLVLATTTALAGPSADTPAGRGARWLVARQADDGAVPAGGRPDEVAEAAVALIAGGAPRASTDRALSYVADRAPSQTTRGGHVARVILGVLAAKRDPRSFGGVDYVARLDAAYNATTGTYDSGVYANGLAFLAVLAVRGHLEPASRTYLTANQCTDGGFSHDTGCTRVADADTTGLVLRVLTVDKANAAARDKARSWLAGVQNDDGGFPLERGGPSNANSTALVLMALVALQERPADAPWRRGGGDPLEALLRLQTASGAFRFVSSGGENDYATVQAVPAVAAFAAPAPTVVEGRNGAVVITDGEPTMVAAGTAIAVTTTTSPARADLAPVAPASPRRALATGSRPASPGGDSGPSRAVMGSGAALLLAVAAATMWQRWRGAL